MMRLTLLIVLSSLTCYAQEMDGPTLLKKTLQYHDPGAEWNNLKATVRYDEYRANNTIRKSVVRFDNIGDRFKLERTNDKLVITRGTVADSCYVLVNGSADFDVNLPQLLFIYARASNEAVGRWYVGTQ